MEKVEWLYGRWRYFSSLWMAWMILGVSHFFTDEFVSEVMAVSIAGVKSNLHNLCRNGATAHVRMILAWMKRVKADCDIPDSKGETPLFTACRKGNVEIVRLLLAAGANANMKNNLESTPLHAVCGKYCPGYSGEGFLMGLAIGMSRYDDADRIQADVEIIRLLVGAGADGTMEDRRGYSPVSFVCFQGRVDVFNLFFEAMNGQWDKLDSKSWTPFHLVALCNRHKPMTQMLASCIADFPIDERSTWEPDKFLHLVMDDWGCEDFQDDYVNFIILYREMGLNPDFLMPAFLDLATRQAVEAGLLPDNGQ